MRRNSYQWIVGAFGLWLAWTLVTWWFEGRIGTLNRPGAVVDRLVYAVTANMIVGVFGSALVLRRMSGRDPERLSQIGFGPLRRTLIWTPATFVIGLSLYVGLGASSAHPVVILNAFVQVLVVSIAEVMVCWALVGGAITLGLRRVRPMHLIVAVITTSLLFGTYHFAHSAPFNTLRMVAFLSGIGLLTSTVFLLSRDVYATILFHNFLGTLGVLRALSAQNALGSFETLQWTLITAGIAGFCTLVAVDVFVIRRNRKDKR